MTPERRFPLQPELSGAIPVVAAPYEHPRTRPFPILLGYWALFLFIQLGVSYLLTPRGLSLWYLPAALSLALVLTLGPAYAPALVVAPLIGNLILLPPGGHLLPAIGIPITHALGYGLAALIARRIRISPELQGTRDVWRFLLLALVIPLFVTVPAIAVSQATRIIAEGQLLNAARRFWAGDVLGLYTLGPFLMVWIHPLVRNGWRASRGPWLSLRPVLLGLQGAVLALCVIATVLFSLPGTLHLKYLLFVPMLWIATQGGLRAVSLALPVLAGVLVATLGAEGRTLAVLSDLQPFFLILFGTTLFLGAAVDEQDRAMASQEKRATHLRHLMEGTGAIPWEMEVSSGTCRELGSQVEGLLGWPLDKWRKQPFWGAVVHPDDQLAFLRFCHQAGRPGADSQLEIRLVAPGGEPRWVRVVAGVEAGSQTSAVLGFLFDIHARKQADEERGRFFQITQELLAIWDAKGVIQDVNPTWEPQLGHPREELLATSMIDLVHPEDRNLVLAALQRLLVEQDQVEFECRFRARPGGHRWLLWSATYLSGLGLAYGAARDITDRKEMELKLRASEDMHRNTAAALHDSEHELRGILDTLPDMIFHLDAKGTYLGLRMSDPGRNLSLRERMVGQSIWNVMPEMAAPAMAAIGRCLAEGQPQSLDYETETADGLHCFEARIIPHKADEVIAIVRDITELKRHEQAIEAALKEKELLLKEIHHRVKNNLQVVSSLLRLQSAAHKDPVLHRALQEAQERVQAIALIHQKLKHAPDSSRLDLASYVQNLAERLVRSYASAPALVDLQIQVDPVLLGPDDAVPLGLILHELVANALQHGFPPGEGGSLEIGVEALPEGQVALRVADSGTGLPEGVDLDSGGLGFQLVRALADQLGGTLELERRRGAAFRLIFTPHLTPLPGP